MEPKQNDADTKRKNPKNLRLTDNAEALLLALADKLGVKQVSVIEIAIRRLADAEGVTLSASAQASSATE